MMASSMHQHGSTIVILLFLPLWKSFNSGILCSSSCPSRPGHNVRLSPWQDKRFCLFCHFLSLYKWESVQSFENSLGPQSCLTLWSHGLWPARLLCPWGFSRQECWCGLPFASPGDLPNWGINSGLLHCRQILYHLSHQECPPVT